MGQLLHTVFTAQGWTSTKEVKRSDWPHKLFKNEYFDSKLLDHPYQTRVNGKTAYVCFPYLEVEAIPQREFYPRLLEVANDKGFRVRVVEEDHSMLNQILLYKEEDGA